MHERAALQLTKEGEARDHKDGVYWAHQPWNAASIKELVDYNLMVDILWPMEKGSGKMSWCQGKVLRRAENGKSREFVVEWDAVEDMEKSEVPTEGIIKLLEGDWRSTKRWGWRLDNGFELLESFYDINDNELMGKDNNCDGEEAALDSDSDHNDNGEGENDENNGASNNETEYMMGLDSNDDEEWIK